MTDHKAKYKEVLTRYIPDKSVDLMADWILRFNFNLKITENRASKLGDYRAPVNQSRHLITINHNLNPYSFLITLVHEIAHLTTYERYKTTYKRVLPHGLEWKTEYKNLMRFFMTTDIFPEDVMSALKSYMLNPAATSCADENLLRILRRYDNPKKALQHVEELPYGATFKHGKNRFFKKGERVRKRFKCEEIATKRMYLFSPLAEVILVSAPLLSE